MQSGRVEIIYGTILQVLGLVLLFIGSIVHMGNIVVGVDAHGAVASTYLHYQSIVQSIIFTLFGAFLFGSVVLLRSSRSLDLRTLTGLTFLGLLVVNIIRLVTLPPDWSYWGSGFELDMLTQFEISTALSFILLLFGLVLYCLSIKSELPSKGPSWFLSTIVAAIWAVILAIMILVVLFPNAHSFGQGYSGVFLFIWVFMLLPMLLTITLILSYTSHKMKDVSSSEKEEKGSGMLP